MLEAIKHNLSQEMPIWEWYITTSSGGQSTIRGTRYIKNVLTDVFMVHLMGTYLIVTHTNTVVLPNTIRTGRKVLRSYEYDDGETIIGVDQGSVEASSTTTTMKCDIADPTFSLADLIKEMKRFEL